MSVVTYKSIIGNKFDNVLQVQTLSASATTITFSNLNGDNDYIYRIYGVFTASAAGCVPALKVNGSSDAKYDSLCVREHTTYARTSTTDGTEFKLMDGASMASGEQAFIEIMIYAKAAATHMIRSKLDSNMGTSGEIHKSTGEWEAPSGSPAITSVAINGGVIGFGGFAANSIFWIVREGPFA